MSGYNVTFDTLFEGTLCGKWPELSVWCTLLAMRDSRGHIDKTPQFIHRVTGIPLEVLNECIARFMQPDPESRTPDDEGRRLRLIDPARQWGWVVINHEVYKERAREVARNRREVDSGDNALRMRRRKFEAVGLTYRGDERCTYCADEATGVDHIDCDGPDQPWNAVPCCQRCNTSKHRRPLLVFLNSCAWINRESVLSESKLGVEWKGGLFVVRPLSTTSDHQRPDRTPSSTLQRTTTTSTPESETTAAIAALTDPPGLLDFKLAYPERAGGQPWKRAVKAIHARMAEGFTWTELIEGARRYAAYCQATGKVGTEFVMQAATFCGPERRFLEPWILPPTKADQRLAGNLDAAAEAKRRLFGSAP